MIWLYENPQVNGLYNVGTGQARNFNDLAHAVYKALNTDPNVTYIDMSESLQPKYQYYTQAKIEKLRLAGYTKDFTSLEHGVEIYVKNFLMLRDPYR